MTGSAAIQAIVIDDRSFERAKRHQDFVRRMVFPAGASPRSPPSPPAWPGPPTCESWTWRTSAATTPRPCGAGRTTWPPTDDAVAALGVSQEFRRLWDLYLAYCEASFLERHISDVQLVLAKPGRAGRLGRAGQ